MKMKINEELDPKWKKKNIYDSLKLYTLNA